MRRSPLAFACGGDGNPVNDASVDAGGNSGDEDARPVDAAFDAGQLVVASGPSRSASVAVDDAATTIAVANRGTDDVIFFDLATREERARVAVGSEPSAVVFHPNGDRAFVLNAGDGTVSEIIGANGGSPSVRITHAVGPGPMGAALSPTGSRLYVSSWTGGRIHVLDTGSGSVSSTPDRGRSRRSRSAAHPTRCA